MTPRERVLAVVAAGRRLADATDPLGREARARLPEAARLSPEGVELALLQHLETSPSASDLDRLLRAETPAPRCHVVLAANVCTAALRAIATAVATSAAVFVKPSRRDPVVAELLVRALAHTLDVALVEQLDPRAGDAVHAYASDETLAAIALALPAGVSLRRHGTGLGVAIVEDDHDLHEAAAAIADDLVAFDGRGCLSPRVVLSHRASSLAEALHRQLLTRGLTVPRGPLSRADEEELQGARQLYQTIGEAHEGPHHAIYVDASPRALALAPACRATVVLGDAAVLASVAPQVAAVGHRGGPYYQRVSPMFPTARRSALGRMQRPPLDGPVDLR